MAFAVSKTDIPETDGAESGGPETDVPETDGPETDVAETGEGDEWRRGMARGGTARTNGPSVLMAFRLREILLCHSSWPLQSRRRRKAETEVPETEVLET